MMPYNPVKTIPSQVVIEAEEEEEEGENRKSAIIVKCTTNNSSEVTADETAAASSLLLECWQPSLIKQIAHTTILAGSNKIRKCWHWSPVASASSVMSAILLYSLGRQGRQIRQRRLRRRSRCRCRKRKCLPLLSITNANKMTNITCCNLDSSSSCQDNNNNQNNNNNNNNNNNESECSSLVQRKQPNSLRDQQQQQQQQELLWLEQQNNRKLHTQTNSLQCLWYTAFLLVIFLSLPSVSYMLPQDSFSTITKTSSILKGLTTNSLPKSLNLSPLHSSSLSAASTTSTSTSTSSSLSSYILLPTTTTTTNNRRRRRTGRIMQDATSATNSAEFLQSTLHSNGQQLRQLRMQSQLKARTATQSRSLYDVQRIVRSAYAEANTDDANVSNGSTMNFSANLDNNNSNNKNHNNNIECPSYNENSVCPCYKFEDGLFLECPGTTSTSLRTTLERISSPIHSLSIYDFDRSVTSLSQDVFQPGVNIRHLQFSHSHLEALKDNSLKHVRASLESLSIVNGKLMQIPTRALNSMQKLSALDFDYNEISKMENYGFYGLRLLKLNMKGNRLQSIPEHGFEGLEESMQEIDLSENILHTFPLLALRKLDHLRILRLSSNKISTFYGDISLVTNNASAAIALRLQSLIFLDLSSNKFTDIVNESFHTFPQLKTLSLYANQIETVQSGSFKSLRELMSLDMSHNSIISLDHNIFDMNTRLQTVDLSHNHIHTISGVFSNLPQLREIFLSENNILELPGDAFANSSNVEVIYLESNAISHVDPNVFSSLVNLDHLYLRTNFIPQVPVTLFDKCHKLASLSLDNNEVQDLEIGMFRKLVLLREIRLHNNRIRRIRKGVFEPLPALQELHIQQNNIEDIEPGAFEKLSHLQHINLQDNQLTVLEDIFPRELSNSSLLSVQLDNNYLHKIHQKTFRFQYRVEIMWLRDNGLTRLDKTMFTDLRDLGRLFLSNNQISDIDRDTFSTVNVSLLDLSNNRLKQLRREYFFTLQNLEELNLSSNHIEAIESFSFSKLKNLKILDLSNNPLMSIARDIFQDELQLTQLNLRNTSLHKIDISTFKSLPNLNELNLEHNFLNPANIQLLDVASLRSLYLSHNDLSIDMQSGMLEKLRSLQHLHMANCSIYTIPDGLFEKNTNLVKLDLCANMLSSFNRNIFSGLNVFKELRLCRNNLMEFPHIALYNLSTLEYLDLSRNQLTSVDFFKLSGTLNLRQLNLQENRINTLSGFSAVNLTQLDNIDLSGNMLLSLPANFLRHSINLQRVDLSSNRFLQIPSSALSDISIPRLSWLNLTANPINKIYTVKEERYPYLKELYICHTNLSILTSKDFESFQALQHLHLVKNRIMRISPGAFKSLSNLLILDLSVNELELLPKERLQGLRVLRLLNISHNILKELEEFSSDLAQLQICDLSYNQMDRISKKTFRNLHGLTELYLMGNRMTVLSTEAFRYLRHLHVLDLRKNYFELIPVESLKPLETNLRTLKIEENPLHCSCDAQKLWEWLRDHRKWALASDKINYLKCEQPAELRGKIFSRMEPQQFCDAPLIPKIAIQDIQPYSVVVSWQSREHLGLNGFEIVYHITTDGNDIDELRAKRLNGSANSAKLTKLSTNTRYHICVIGTGNWLSETVVNALQKIYHNESLAMQSNEAQMMQGYNFLPQHQHQQQQQQHHGQWYTATTGQQQSADELDVEFNVEPQQQQALIEKNTIVRDTHALLEVLKNSHISACTDVQTLDSTPSLMADENGLASSGFLHSILTRRLGLIVGCCLGIIVFIVMISILSYVKLKKQRLESAKRQAALPPEYMSYRHFSIPNDELRSATTVMSSVPSGISAHISGTSLSGSSANTATVTSPLSNALPPLKAINEDSVGTGSEANVSLADDVPIGPEQTETNLKVMVLNSGAVTTTASNHNQQAHQMQHLLHHAPGLPQQQHNNQHHHHHHHPHLLQQQQQQQINHVGGNGSVMGYMAAGVVLGTNNLNSR